MHVEQAIFTSARTRHAQGYHLTSRSPGITDDVARALSVWSPSHGGLIDTAPVAVSLSYFPLASNRGVLARSVYGGPEYSDRGGLQIVTRMLVFGREQLAGYANNPLHLARIALALGHLRLSGRLEPVLEPVELPDRTVLAEDEGTSIVERPGGTRDREKRSVGAMECSCNGVLGESPERNPNTPALHDSNNPDFPALARQLAERLARGSRLAVIGAVNPRELLEALFHCTPAEARSDLSFTTGLWPSMQRSFRVQFLPAVDTAVTNRTDLGRRKLDGLLARLRGPLAAQGVEFVDLAALSEQGGGMRDETGSRCPVGSG